jgi:hypothetical protein
MADWKRLTLERVGDVKVDVNFDHVIYMVRENDRTRLYFVGGPNNENNVRSIDVKERPEDLVL